MSINFCDYWNSKENIIIIDAQGNKCAIIIVIVTADSKSTDNFLNTFISYGYPEIIGVTKFLRNKNI